jgi:predicted nucleotidyltransferase
MEGRSRMLQPTGQHELEDFLAYIVSVLERLKIQYMVVGGFAAVAYGEFRFTADVDIVVDMQYRHVDAFVAAFPIPDYYVSREGILDSLARRYPFNVIQPATGVKADLVPLPADPRSRAAFARRQRIVYDEINGRAADFAAAEDVLVAKLCAYQETGSERHLRDARGILVTQWGRLKLENIRRWARAAGVEETWQILLQVARREMAGEEAGEPKP